MKYNYIHNTSVPLNLKYVKFEVFFEALFKIKISDEECVKGLFLLSHEISLTYFIEEEYAKCLQLLYLIVSSPKLKPKPKLFIN